MSSPRKCEVLNRKCSSMAQSHISKQDKSYRRGSNETAKPIVPASSEFYGSNEERPISSKHTEYGREERDQGSAGEEPEQPAWPVGLVDSKQRVVRPSLRRSGPTHSSPPWRCYQPSRPPAPSLVLRPCLPPWPDGQPQSGLDFHQRHCHRHSHRVVGEPGQVCLADASTESHSDARL